MKIGVIQQNIIPGDKEANFRRVENLVSEVCATCAPDFLVLPELWSTGYVLREFERLASNEGDEERVFLGGLARKYDVWFGGGSVVAKTSAGIANRAQIINRQGVQEAFYDKMHLVPMFREEQYLVAGEMSCVHSVEGVCFGFALCYDIRFGELVRKLALEGAEALIVAAEWPLLRLKHWQTLLAARAIENQFYLFAANTMAAGSSPFAGHSQALGPDGAVLHALEFEEGAFCADIDLNKVKEARTEVPVFQSRRPDLYL